MNIKDSFNKTVKYFKDQRAKNDIKNLSKALPFLLIAYVFCRITVLSIKDLLANHRTFDNLDMGISVVLIMVGTLGTYIFFVTYLKKLKK